MSGESELLAATLAETIALHERVKQADPGQVLAAAVGAAGWPGIEATVSYDDAPFGVEYLVADWAPRS